MESKKLQKAIGLYIISEMKKENTLNVAQFTLLRQLIETENEIINEIFIDFDPSDDIKMKNRFLHLLLELNLSSSDDENSNNTSASYDDVSSPFATVLLTKKKEKHNNGHGNGSEGHSLSGFRIKKNGDNA